MTIKRRDFLAGLGAAGPLALAGRAAASSQPASTGRWDGLGSQFQFPAGFTYLNTAGLGACPRASATA